MIAYSMTFLLPTGNAPGSPRVTGSMYSFGSPPYAAEALQKIFDFVES
jgi:hypothetical protein